jgi:hypothetical protein
MEKTAEKYINMEEFKNNVINIFSGILEKRMMSFEEQLNKLETIE